jgi:hypothetical protein
VETLQRDSEPKTPRKLPLKRAFFIALNKYTSQATTSEKTPKERPKTASQEKTDGATNTQPPKTRTETGQKRTKATPTGKHSRKAETSRERAGKHAKKGNGESTATKHGERTPRKATSGAGESHHEPRKKDSRSRPKKRGICLPQFPRCEM